MSSLHAISRIETPELVWFYERRRVVLRISDTHGREVFYPVWVMMREETATGAVLEYTLPDPGQVMN